MSKRKWRGRRRLTRSCGLDLCVCPDFASTSRFHVHRPSVVMSPVRSLIPLDFGEMYCNATRSLQRYKHAAFYEGFTSSVHRNRRHFVCLTGPHVVFVSSISYRVRCQSMAMAKLRAKKHGSSDDVLPPQQTRQEYSLHKNQHTHYTVIDGAHELYGSSNRPCRCGT